MTLDLTALYDDITQALGDLNAAFDALHPITHTPPNLARVSDHIREALDRVIDARDSIDDVLTIQEERADAEALAAPGAARDLAEARHYDHEKALALGADPQSPHRRQLIFDDDYNGPRWRYALRYRPAVLGITTPHGAIIHSDRPHPQFRHGTIDYPYELRHDEVDGYELELLEVLPTNELGLDPEP